jgi:hypothetical protein
MTELRRFWGIAAGCVLACSQQATAGENRTIDMVFANDAAWVNPIQLAHAETTGDHALNIQQVSCFGSEEELGDPWTVSSLMGDDPCVNIGGWLAAGYHNRPDGTFLDYPHHAQLTQGWLFAEKATDGADGLDFGGRVDVMYGTDAANTQSFGNTPGVFDFSDTFNHGEYGWAIPQLYAEVAYHDWKVKAGHFFTLLGWEVVPATGNFFYSHAFTMNYSEAFTHTGAVATYTGVENFEFYGGWTLGWDTGFDQLDGGNSFLGGAKYTGIEDISFIYITTFGNLGWLGKGYTHSLVADFALTDKLHYIAQSDYVDVYQSDFTGKDYYTIGFNNYLIYWATDRVGLGTRAEWWKAQGVSYYEVTAGVNFKPIPNFVIRPEFRYQWSPAAEGNPANNQMAIPSLGDGIFGVDGILTF